MKFSIITAMVAMLMSTSATIAGDRSSLGSEEQIATEDVLQSKIIIYDYNGDLIKELNLTDVKNDKISVSDHLLLQQSDFAFSYLGDDYYFKNS